MHLSVIPKQIIVVLTLVCSALIHSKTHAHTTGETYVWLNVERENITGRVEINLNDLREKLKVPVPEQSDLQEDFLESNRELILKYIKTHFEIRADETLLPVEYTTISVLALPGEEGSYAQYHYQTPSGRVPDIITIRNSLFVDFNFTHRSLVCVERNRKSGQEFEGEFTAMVFGSHNPEQELDLTHIELLLRPRDFVWQGILHIWIGIDHILFIIALLLPAVLRFERAEQPTVLEAEGEKDGDQSGWSAVPSFRIAFWNILRIVTIFTIAHSITLSLAALGVVRLPSRLIESVIAFSIVLVVWNTFTQQFKESNWFIIFGFGLFHGMGFASVMSDLPFRMVHLIKVLIGFNVGVEIGQLAIVAIVFPVLFLLRKCTWFVPVILQGGSLIIGLVAMYWFIERAFAL